MLINTLLYLLAMYRICINIIKITSRRMFSMHRRLFLDYLYIVTILYPNISTPY